MRTSRAISHKVAAAIKVWLDSISGEARANLYFPDRVLRYSTPITTSEFSSIDVYSEAFAIRGGWQVIEEVGHDYGTVPMVPFTTRPDYRGYGRSDLRDLAEIIYRIEYLTSNTMLAVELGALKQKWATGLEIPTDPDGNAVEPFKVALDRLWISEDPETKFGSFPATDIGPYLKAISDAIGQLSAVSRIPPTYFVQPTSPTRPPLLRWKPPRQGLSTRSASGSGLRGVVGDCGPPDDEGGGGGGSNRRPRHPQRPVERSPHPFRLSGHGCGGQHAVDRGSLGGDHGVRRVHRQEISRWKRGRLPTCSNN